MLWTPPRGPPTGTPSGAGRARPVFHLLPVAVAADSDAHHPCRRPLGVGAAGGAVGATKCARPAPARLGAPDRATRIADATERSGSLWPPERPRAISSARHSRRADSLIQPQTASALCDAPGTSLREVAVTSPVTPGYPDCIDHMIHNLDHGERLSDPVERDQAIAVAQVWAIAALAGTVDQLRAELVNSLKRPAAPPR